MYNLELSFIDNTAGWVESEKIIFWSGYRIQRCCTTLVSVVIVVITVGFVVPL